MKVNKIRHLTSETPISEAQNDKELAELLVLRGGHVRREFETDAMGFAFFMSEVCKLNAWRAGGYESLADFCTKFLDSSVEEVEQVLKGVKKLKEKGTNPNAIITWQQAINEVEYARENPIAKHGEIGRGRDRDNNIMSTQQGTSTEYTLRRLARDGRDDLLDAIEAGEKTVNAAAIEAGYRKTPCPLRAVQRNWLKLTAEQQQAFDDWRIDQK